MTEQNQAEKVEKVINNVTMADGSIKNFGKKGKLLSETEVSISGFILKFFVITGEVFSYEHSFGQDLDKLTATMAAFGAAQRVKTSIAGAEVEEISSIVGEVIEEFKNGEFATRASSGEVISPLTQIQTAFAIVNGFDIEKDVVKIQAVWAALSEAEKAEVRKNKAVKREVARLRFEAAEAAFGS